MFDYANATDSYNHGNDALASCLLMTPAVLAGAWLAGCKMKTWRKWDQNVGFNNNQKAQDIIPMCVIPGYYYSEPNEFVPSCSGTEYMAGFCDSKVYGWYCDSSDLKAWGTARRFEGDCYKQFNADGTERKFYVPCTGTELFGYVNKIRAQCDGK